MENDQVVQAAENIAPEADENDAVVAAAVDAVDDEVAPPSDGPPMALTITAKLSPIDDSTAVSANDDDDGA